MHYLAIAILNEGKAEKEIVENAWKKEDELKIQTLREAYKRKIEDRLNELEGKNFDAWGVLDVTTAEWLINNLDNLDRQPEAVLTLEKEWLRMPWHVNWRKRWELENEWDERIMSMLKMHKDAGIVVLIDIDS